MESEEQKVRSLWAIDEPGYDSDPELNLVEEAISRPDEKFAFQDLSGQQFYVHIKNTVTPFRYLILICLYYDNSPSLVLFHTQTSEVKIIDFFKELALGEALQTTHPEKDRHEIKREQVEISQEILLEVEQKKSQILAELLNLRADSDIPYENFNQYEQYIADTLEKPDQIYQASESMGEIYYYLKAFLRQDDTFYYVVICTKTIGQMSDIEHSEQEVILPIITFPTNDFEIYQEFQRGLLAQAPLKN